MIRLGRATDPGRLAEVAEMLGLQRAPDAENIAQLPIPLWNRILCQNNQNAKLRKVIRQQDLYALMRRRPELFPITSYVQQMNLSLADQRRYSNL